LLRAVADAKIALDLDNISISMISLFELQAKVAKLNLPARLAVNAVDVINTIFKVEPFYNPEVIKTSQSLLEVLKDYIDCIIVATAIVLHEDLITEDSRIIANKKFIKERYGIGVFAFKDLK
jgi:PIN domain nuclease of toxin-antitoxin system